jgi:2-amino-4-hydroxy-6-hydroxymethyldihydropteridine diphosphokinase
MPHQALLALGSNLGDRQENIRRALFLLEKTPNVRLIRQSCLYETEPQGMRPDDPAQAFVNAAAMLETSLSPANLLEVCLKIEKALGRKRLADRTEGGYSSRTIDLDVLFYDDRVIQEAGLEIPHPRLHERGFVLVPLSEIAPDWRHPVLGRTIAQLAERFRGTGEVCPVPASSAGTILP